MIISETVKGGIVTQLSGPCGTPASGPPEGRQAGWVSVTPWGRRYWWGQAVQPPTPTPTSGEAWSTDAGVFGERQIEEVLRVAAKSLNQPPPTPPQGSECVGQAM